VGAVEHELASLIEAAKTARRDAYAPYSGFKVGAALLCPDGTVFTGCNVENVVFGETVCAEKTAVVKAVSDGRREFTALAVVCSGSEPCPVCGSCRQTLAEFGSELRIVSASVGGIRIVEATLAELLPKAFTPETLSGGQMVEPPEPSGPGPWP
jgi:cytidine deaminase